MPTGRVGKCLISQSLLHDVLLKKSWSSDGDMKKTKRDKDVEVLYEVQSKGVPYAVTISKGCLPCFQKR
jgi:hypothetical protein